MSYVNRNLLAGERVVYRTRLYWLLLAWPVVFLIVVAVPIGWLATTDQWNDLAWIPLGIAVLVLLGAIIKRQSSDFAVTNKRVIYCKGLVSVATDELFLDKIESVLVTQGLLGRWWGYGSVSVRGTGGSWEPFWKK